MYKLYCYVDESGQDATGRLFVVAIIVIQGSTEEIHQLCEELERVSGKGKFKWGKAKHELRMAYLRRIFADDRLTGRLRYAVFQNTRKYDEATIDGISRAILFERVEQYTSLVYVDGLSKTKRHEYGSALRKSKVYVKKVQGVTKDENNALTRLADALAGFVHDALDEPESEIGKLLTEVKRKGIVVEV